MPFSSDFIYNQILIISNIYILVFVFECVFIIACFITITYLSYFPQVPFLNF
jgi:hypothetical protein